MASVSDITKKISAAFAKYASISRAHTVALLPASLTSGKLYEAYVLSRVAEQLVTREGVTLTLVGGSNVKLRSSPGPIDPRFPHFDVRRRSSLVGEIWTDIEFLSLSYSMRGGGSRTRGDYHELDILLVSPGTTGMPRPDQILLGIECKNRGYSKSLLKEILGIRRELSFVTDSHISTPFRAWPATGVPANPPSCLLVYSSDTAVSNYNSPGQFFGIDFIYDSP